MACVIQPFAPCWNCWLCHVTSLMLLKSGLCSSFRHPGWKSSELTPWLTSSPRHLHVLFQNTTQAGCTMCEIPPCYPDPALRSKVTFPYRSWSLQPMWTLAGQSHHDATPASSFLLMHSFFVSPTRQVYRFIVCWWGTWVNYQTLGSTELISPATGWAPPGK